MSELTHKEMSSRGGRATKTRLGEAHYLEIGLKGLKTKFEHGRISEPTYEATKQRMEAKLKELLEKNTGIDI